MSSPFIELIALKLKHCSINKVFQREIFTKLSYFLYTLGKLLLVFCQVIHHPFLDDV